MAQVLANPIATASVMRELARYALITLDGNAVKVHRRSDVPIGGYVSGGLDSSIVASIARDQNDTAFLGFTGKFSVDEKYDESAYARDLDFANMHVETFFVRPLNAILARNRLLRSPRAHRGSSGTRPRTS